MDWFHIKKKKTKESRLKNFQIENYEDEIEEQEFEILIWKWSQVMKNPTKKMKNKYQTPNKN